MFSYNSQPKSLHIHILFLLLLLCLASFSQTYNDPDWHRSIDQELKGNVKSWTMKRGAKVIRQQQYDRGGALVKDSRLKQTVFFVNPIEIMDTVKTYEKTYALKDTQVLIQDDNTVTYTEYNHRGQLLKQLVYDLVYKKGQLNPDRQIRFGLENQFNAKGQIVVSLNYTVQTHIRYWNSLGHNPPYYYYTDSNAHISLFRYNERGDITGFEHYNKDPFKNVKVDYRYDSNHHLIEKDIFDDRSVVPKYFHDEKITKKIIDDVWRLREKFDVNRNWPKYWYSTIPGVSIIQERWEYNGKGQRVTYTTSSDFKAVWNYNNDDIISEKHYISDPAANQKEWLYTTMSFDRKGNVISMTIYDRWEKKTYDFTFDITYY